MEKIKALVRLEESLNKLPSVGKKSSERMAYAILDMADEDVFEMAEALFNLKKSIKRCPICGNLTDEDVCNICKDETRNKELLMVVSYPKDIIAFENSEGFKGVYHVLNGVISLNKGKTLEELNYSSLVERIKENNVQEVILATNPTIEGETTALYIARKLQEFENLTITRLAYGLTMGGNLDYTDSITLGKALEGRRKI